MQPDQGLGLQGGRLEIIRPERQHPPRGRLGVGVAGLEHQGAGLLQPQGRGVAAFQVVIEQVGDDLAHEAAAHMDAVGFPDLGRIAECGGLVAGEVVH